MKRVKAMPAGYSKAEGETLYYLHQLVLEELGKYDSGRLLEISPGGLRLWKQIENLNRFKIHGCDIDCHNASIKHCDLNEDNIPFDDEFFENVVCCEVIEHIHDPWKLIAEAKRVMKSKGKLIITTPNVSKMYDRLHYLLKGFVPSFGGLKFKSYMQHINPINIRELLLILNKHGFEINDVKYNIFKKYHGLFPKGWFGYSVAVFATKE